MWTRTSSLSPRVACPNADSLPYFLLTTTPGATHSTELPFGPPDAAQVSEPFIRRALACSLNTSPSKLLQVPTKWCGRAPLHCTVGALSNAQALPQLSWGPIHLNKSPVTFEAAAGAECCGCDVIGGGNCCRCRFAAGPACTLAAAIGAGTDPASSSVRSESRNPSKTGASLTCSAIPSSPPR